MVPTAYMGVEIDTPEDLRRAELLMAGSTPRGREPCTRT
jgi:hypothetical protein